MGNLPNYGATVATLNPAAYPDGSYTLQLTPSVSDLTLMASSPITIETAAKTGNLVLPVTDGVLNSSGGPITISRTYDSNLADVSGDLGAGWTLNLLDAQLHTTATTDTLNPADSTPVLRRGSRIPQCSRRRTTRVRIRSDT